MHISKLTTNLSFQAEIIDLFDGVWNEVKNDESIAFFRNLLFYDLVKEKVSEGFTEMANAVVEKVKEDPASQVPKDDIELRELACRFAVEQMIDHAFGRTVGAPESVSLQAKLKPCEGESFRKFNHRILYFRSPKLLVTMKAMHFETLPGSDGILAYGYIDKDAGLSFKGICCANIGADNTMQLAPCNPSTSLSIRSETIRDAQYIDMLETNTELYEFSDIISLTKQFYEDTVPSAVLRMRDYTFLDSLRHPEFPDDVQVVLYKDGQKPEVVWVRCMEPNVDEGLLYGRLLNEPHADYGWHSGDVVSFRYIQDDDNGDSCCVYIGVIQPSNNTISTDPISHLTLETSAKMVWVDQLSTDERTRICNMPVPKLYYAELPRFLRRFSWRDEIISSPEMSKTFMELLIGELLMEEYEYNNPITMALFQNEEYLEVRKLYKDRYGKYPAQIAAEVYKSAENELAVFEKLNMIMNGEIDDHIKQLLDATVNRYVNRIIEEVTQLIDEKRCLDEIEEYEYDEYFDNRVVSYDDGDIAIDGICIGICDKDKFADDIDFSDGLTLPNWFDDYYDDAPPCELISLESYALAGLQALWKITIPEGVLVVGRAAFEECDQLESVTLPSTLKYIGMDAFSECSALEEISLPDALTVISRGAFSCSGLKSITIPAGVKWIGTDAFSSCESLESVIIFSSDLKMDGDVFNDCAQLKHVTAPISLAPQLIGQLNCNGIHPKYHWIDTAGNLLDQDAVSCRMVYVNKQNYTDGTTGTTVKFELTNNFRKDIVLDVPKVYLVHSVGVKLHDFWLTGNIVRNVTLSPGQSITCAAIFDDDELPVDSVEDAVVGLLFTVDREIIEEDECSDRYCTYEGSDYSPGEWTDILELERFGYFGVLFKHSNCGWYVHSSDLPQMICTPKTEIPEIQFADFVVRVSLFRCLHNHNIEPIQALVNVLMPDGSVMQVQVSAGYCHECQCYFILEQDFLQLQRKGKLLCQLIAEHEYLTKGDSLFSGEDMKAESVLRRCGYTVNAKDDLSDQQRQGILMQVVDSGIYSVSELCAFLDWLIEYQGRSRTRNMKPAVSKWMADREFIKNYRMGSRRQIGINGIRY